MTSIASTPAETPATLPLLTLVRALGAELYIDGVRVCPWCREDFGSRFCTCHPTAEREVIVTWPKDEHGQPLRPIDLDLRDGPR